MFNFYTTHKTTNPRTLTDMEVQLLNKPKVIGVAVGSLAAIILAISLNPFHVVPTGSRGVITQFGQIKNIEPEGLVVLPPWQKLDIFNVRAETADIENAQGSTNDTQPVAVSMTVRYSITPDKVSEVFEKYSRNGDLTSYVTTATMEVFKAVTAQYSATDLIAKRALVSSNITEALGVKLKLYGAQVVNIDMRNFAFSDSYMAAVNDKVTQEQKRQAAENKVKTIEAEQRAVVVTAEAQAKATIMEAEAQAKSIKLQADALRENTGLLELKRIEVDMAKAQKWNGALPVNMYSSGPVPYLNIGK